MSDSDPRPAPEARLVAVGPDYAGQRIDNFLLRCLKGVPKSRIYRLLRKGEVRVNRGRVRPGHRLVAGDQVRLPPVRTGDPPAKMAPSAQVQAQVAARILYENSHLLVLNKPAGLAVHGGSGLDYGIIELLRVLRPDTPALELVHRLDRETSGCLLLAKTRPALQTLHDLFRGQGMDKHYLALVKGRWPGSQRQVTVPLRKNVLRSGERRVEAGTGRAAETWFNPVRTYSNATLVEAVLGSGRTHQIRVHAQHIGHPVGGDSKYGDRAFNKALRQRGLKRLFLHAWRLSLPWGEERLELEAPLDDDLEQVLKKLQQTPFNY